MSFYAQVHLTDFFMQAPNPMAILEGQNHRVTFANFPFENFFRKEMTGKTFAEGFLKGETDDFISLLDQVYASGEDFIGTEMQITLPAVSGKVKKSWINVKFHAYRDSDQTIKGVFVFIYDIVDLIERREIEETFERHQLETLFALSPAGMALWTGPKLVFEKFNSHYQAIFPDRDLKGKAFADALPEVSAQGFHDIILKVLQTGEPYLGHEIPTQILNLVTQQLELHYFDFSLLQVCDPEGLPYGVFVHAVDVTDRAIGRQALEKSRNDLQSSVLELRAERELRERFVATLTHDLRTPLTAGKIGAQILQRKLNQSTELQLIASKISTNMDRADLMIRDLLDASSIQGGGHLPLEFEACDLNSIAQDTLENLGTIHGDRFVLQAQVQIEGYMSKNGVQRILENLCTNAIKYGAPARPVRVMLSKIGEEVSIEVQNEGNPISESDQSILFNPFARTQSAQIGSQNGWGLGLTLVKGIAEAHGGRVSVSSSPINGTRFRVNLPQNSVNKSSLT